ncbi:MAG: GAF domain-containing protein [Bdellovibrionales bacterium]|nr:GAF domain-containing protein [Ramlibacter sp.]
MNIPAKPASPKPVTLANCDNEPIHTPGFIQPHGALFAFDAAQRLVNCSANAAALLGVTPIQLGELLAASHFPGYDSVHQLMADVQASPDSDVVPYATEVHGPGGTFDVIAYRTATGVICEFEARMGAAPIPTGFSFVSHRSMERLKREQSMQGLLQAAVEEIRRWTGFDRVMAYRFRHDDSGDVVAEALDGALQPFLGRRYPAGDIPAQARRLYVINTVRLIADTRMQLVRVDAAPTAVGPLDMSHGILRSVSPVHIEYLNNMGVGASMSVSIVIGGRLWGMLACHHRAPLRMAYAVRMACDVLAQVLAANLQGILSRDSAARAHAAASLRLRVVEAVLHANDIVRALAQAAQALQDGFNADGVVVANVARQEISGGMPAEVATALIDWLNADDPAPGRMRAFNSLDGLPQELRDKLGGWCGVLGLPFGAEARSWLLLLRKEQIETVMWGGKPEKVYKPGPLGARLTPRGSFDLWREIVRGQAVPWDDSDLANAQKMLDELVRADAAQYAEIARARNQLMAMLGHDLRSPIQAISLTATLLERRGEGGNLSRGLHSSSSRMQRLVEQVMDMSQLHSGLLKFNMQKIDLAGIIHQLVAESRLAYPDVNVTCVVPRRLEMLADGDRMGQVVSNLLGNACQHGTLGEPVLVQLNQEGGEAVLDVSNAGASIPGDVADSLFQPFKRLTSRSATNRNGLGIGLYITEQIVTGHGGRLAYSYAEPYVTFSVRLPLAQ